MENLNILSLMDLYSQRFLICQDKIKNKGEDSYIANINQNAGIIGVYDGCGGIGARKYEEYDNQTGAFIASRVVAEGVNEWFNLWCEKKEEICSSKYLATPIKETIDKKLSTYREGIVKKSILKGGMQKDFPTTAAMAIVRNFNGKSFVNILWSGDSRVYWLDNKGLHQLSCDDVEGEDAMSNIHNDGVLKNVVSASNKYVLHEYAVENMNKGMLFTATDGCFGFLQSPMHFEFLFLDTLRMVSNIKDWENEVKKSIVNITGDDATISGILIGFDDFTDVKNYYMNRHVFVKKNYIDIFDNITDEEKKNMWTEYQREYLRILEANIE